MTELEAALKDIEEGVKALRVLPGCGLEAHDIQRIVDELRQEAMDNASASAA